MSTKILTLVTAPLLLVITVSVGYYFFYILPQKEQRIIRTECLNSVEGQTDEIKENTTYDPFVDDRGCFLEAGCMEGIIDPDYASKFDFCNKEYYQTCLTALKTEADARFEIEKERRVQSCIDGYNK